MKSIFLFKRHISLVFILSIVLLSYQNCSQVKFSESSSQAYAVESTGGVGVEPLDGSIIINNGAEFTNKLVVQVKLQANNAIEYYLTSDPSCSKEGEWKKFQDKVTAVIPSKQGLAHLYVKFKGPDLKLSDCKSDSIFLDINKPTVQITSGPAAINNKSTASLSFTADDRESGLKEIQFRSETDSNFRVVNGSVTLSTTQGAYKVYLRSLDKAGNFSDVVTYSWIVDTTAPGIEFLETPPSSTNSQSALFKIKATDPLAGFPQQVSSGVSRFLCYFDAEQEVECSDIIVKNLSVGAHVFFVRAVDRAGNTSAYSKYQWTILAPPVTLGDFNVIGVSSSPQVNPSSWLVGTTVPTVFITAAAHAVSYDYIIKNIDGTIKCNSQRGTALSMSMSNCSLSDTVKYTAEVMAADERGTRLIKNTTFTVDLSPPSIVVKPIEVASDQTSAVVNFTITDISGVKEATCIDVFNGVSTTYNCTGLTTLKLSNLAAGAHKFFITAKDNNLQSANSTVVNYNLQPVVCDPFTTGSGSSCSATNGLIGELFYFGSAQDPSLGVDHYISNGTQVPARIIMSQVAVTNRSWESGFDLGSAGLAKNAQGEALTEYFALRLYGALKATKPEEEGLYQVVIFSDDGSIVDYDPVNAFDPVKPSESYQYTNLINSDGWHPYRMGCAPVGRVINLKQDKAIPIRIKYFQGPRTYIGLTLSWKKVTDPNAAADPNCGNLADDGSLPAGYETQNGWKVIPKANLLTPKF